MHACPRVCVCECTSAHRHAYHVLKVVKFRGTFGALMALLNDMSEEMERARVEVEQTRVWHERGRWESTQRAPNVRLNTSNVKDNTHTFPP